MEVLMYKRKLILITGLLLVFVLVSCGTAKVSETPTSTEAHDHEHGSFEWIGQYEFKAGTYMLHFGASTDETMDIGFVKMDDNVTDLEHHASHIMSDENKEDIDQGATFEAKPDYAYKLKMDPEHGHIHFIIAEDATYSIITEHLPSESNMQVFDASEKEILPASQQEFHSH